MKIEFQRKLDRVLGSIICRLFSLFEAFRPDIPVQAEPRNILVILLSEMGSLVMARPMLDHLKRTYPGASIYALLFERNREFLELLDVIPSQNIITVSVGYNMFFGDRNANPIGDRDNVSLGLKYLF